MRLRPAVMLGNNTSNLEIVVCLDESAPTASPISIIIFHQLHSGETSASISVDEKFDLISILK